MRVTDEFYWRDFIRMNGHEFEFPDDETVRRRDFFRVIWAQIAGMAAELEYAKNAGSISATNGFIFRTAQASRQARINAETFCRAVSFACL